MGGASVSVGVVLGSSPRRNPLPFPSTVIPFQLQARVCPLVHASRLRLLCNSTSSPGGPPPGENDSRQVLDAFFLGKAVAEALTERIESTVGEFLSTIGRLQAEQQKQVQDFQEEVLEKAKKAKEKAAKEAMEEQGLVPTENPSPIFASDSYKVTPVSDPAVSTQGEEASGGEEPLLGGPTDHMRDE